MSTIDGYHTALSPYAHMLNSLLENDGSFNMRESVYFAKKSIFLPEFLIRFSRSSSVARRKNGSKILAKNTFCEIHRFPHIETSIIFITLAVYEMTLKSNSLPDPLRASTLPNLTKSRLSSVSPVRGFQQDVLSIQILNMMNILSNSI